jgi:hypothetical protein
MASPRVSGPDSRTSRPSADAGRYDAFLCYAREDADFAVNLVQDALQARDKSVWVDAKDIFPGSSWRERVKRAPPMPPGPRPGRSPSFAARGGATRSQRPARSGKWGASGQARSLQDRSDRPA